jgi:hypothetical protein
VTKKFPNHPANPERICWGCDLYCTADSMKCGNGSDRTQHPFELFGEDWRAWGHDFVATPDNPPQIAKPDRCRNGGAELPADRTDHSADDFVMPIRRAAGAATHIGLRATGAISLSRASACPNSGEPHEKKPAACGAGDRNLAR